MADSDNMVLYAAVYDDLDDALTDLKSIEQLHKDEVIGKFDAAVIDTEDGKPHVVKRIDRPRIRFIAEAFGSGTLPRKELHDAANELGPDQVALIMAGEPTIEKAFDKAVTKSAKVVKRKFDTSVDEIARELHEDVKS